VVNLSAEDQFNKAKKLFDKESYLDAKEEFLSITLKFPGSTLADDAQFYLAECHFKMKEYLIASSEYERLLNQFPNSELIEKAQYQIALSYFKLSPRFSLDQEYTYRAVSEFQRFLEDFPNSELAKDAESKISECRTKLAQKEFKNAEIYRKIGEHKSAIIYYDTVLDNFYDTKFAEESLYWKAESYFELKEYNNAKKNFLELMEKYPGSQFKNKVEERLKTIEKLSSQENEGKK
jgi:outer membrane protein assembly factor BamD